ncbi:MAG: L,D-transpeptidase family protein [Rhodospirillales bacterium]|nr:L,D-transpeptidase family protein [Rhodospirillales bacterium]
MSDLVVSADGVCRFGGKDYRCALGSGGIVANKREGDGGTPVGTWPLRHLLYRPDKGEPPRCILPSAPIAPDDGWCDAPDHTDYNHPVRLPFDASHEEMWRDDHLYDLVVVVGHNDDPPVAGAGSAIFLHLARHDWGPTAGCVAFTRDDFEEILAGLTTESRLIVES